MGRSALALSLGLAVTLLACSQSVPVQSAQKADTSMPTFQFDAAKSWAHLLKQCEFGPRYPGSEAHKKTRDWIAEEMKKSCENVRLQPFSHTWSVNRQRIEMWNILGEQNWKDAKVRVVLLAHWDTRPTADMEYDPDKAAKPITGANDGASGVAVLLELMRATKGRLPKDLGVLYLMTDGEDLGPELDEMFLGAVAFAKNPGAPRPDYGILLDMVGDKNLTIPMEPQSAYYAKPLLDAFFNMAHKAGLGRTFPKSYGPTIEDDHIPLNKAGIPTIDLIDFDYRPWHTLADTPDKCSAESLGKVGKAMEAWLLQEPVWAYPKER